MAGRPKHVLVIVVYAVYKYPYTMEPPSHYTVYMYPCY